jgi:TolB-like protein
VVVARAAVAAFVALTAIGVVVARARSGRPTPEPVAPPRIAVLPFENLGRADDEAFSAGITEEITSRLAGISGLRVVSRTSAKRFVGRTASMKDVGKALNADYVLEGTVRMDRASSGTGTARVTPQLIRVSDDTHVWEQAFDASLIPGEIFRVQGAIAAQVATAMNVTLLEREKGRMARGATRR